jgi:hypothetical protein
VTDEALHHHHHDIVSMTWKKLKSSIPRRTQSLAEVHCMHEAEALSARQRCLLKAITFRARWWSNSWLLLDPLLL